MPAGMAVRTVLSCTLPAVACCLSVAWPAPAAPALPGPLTVPCPHAKPPLQSKPQSLSLAAGGGGAGGWAVRAPTVGSWRRRAVRKRPNWDSEWVARAGRSAGGRRGGGAFACRGQAQHGGVKAAPQASHGLFRSAGWPPLRWWSVGRAVSRRSRRGRGGVWGPARGPSPPQPAAAAALQKMKQLISSRTLVIPDEVSIEVKARRVRVKGPRGECRRGAMPAERGQGARCHAMPCSGLQRAAEGRCRLGRAVGCGGRRVAQREHRRRTGRGAARAGQRQRRQSRSTTHGQAAWSRLKGCWQSCSSCIMLWGALALLEGRCGSRRDLQRAPRHTAAHCAVRGSRLRQRRPATPACSAVAPGAADPCTSGRLAQAACAQQACPPPNLCLHAADRRRRAAAATLPQAPCSATSSTWRWTCS